MGSFAHRLVRIVLHEKTSTSLKDRKVRLGRRLGRETSKGFGQVELPGAERQGTGTFFHAYSTAFLKFFYIWFTRKVVNTGVFSHIEDSLENERGTFVGCSCSTTPISMRVTAKLWEVGTLSRKTDCPSFFGEVINHPFVSLFIILSVDVKGYHISKGGV